VLSTRVFSLACAVALLICLVAPVSAQLRDSAERGRVELPRSARQLPLVAMVGTVTLLSAVSLGSWRTPRR